MEKNCHFSSGSSRHWIRKSTTLGSNLDGQDEMDSKVLPVILVQDPYPWINDICKDRPSEVVMEASGTECPRLLDDEDKPVPVTMQSGASSGEGETRYDSLAHLWNQWNGAWWQNKDDTPRLIIRSEDVLLHPKDLVRNVCRCVGGVVHEPFRNKPLGHIDTVPEKLKGYGVDTMQFVVDAVDLKFMEALGY